MEGKAAWISRAFMHLEALCMPETPFPDYYKTSEFTRRLLLPQPRRRSAQFGLHKGLAMLDETVSGDMGLEVIISQKKHI
jgi:hypothetical protein